MGPGREREKVLLASDREEELQLRLGLQCQGLDPHTKTRPLSLADPSTVLNFYIKMVARY